MTLFNDNKSHAVAYFVQVAVNFNDNKDQTEV